MKQETKALIEWIKAQIKIAAKLDDSYLITTDAISTHKSLEKDAEKFFDSLPEIESHLCRGGYIQDKNGTPCCDGDKISFRINKCNPIYFNNHLLLNESLLTGYLRWIDFKGGFSIVYTEEKKYTSNTIFLTLIDISEFEKVEND